MKMKKQLLALLLAAVLVVGLTGCKETLKRVAQKVTGTLRRSAGGGHHPLGRSHHRPADHSGHCGCLGKVCHGHGRRLPVCGVQRHLEPQHRLLYRARRQLNIMACGTAEGTQKFKVALWKKVDGGAEYVPDSTYYIKTDGTDYRCTISGLDPAAQYRVTISYDSSRYYLYGLMKVEGIAG